MKRLLQQVGRALVVYAGAAYVGDRLVRPHWALFRAQQVAKKLDKPLLVIGYQLTRPLGDVSVDIATASFPLSVEDASVGCVLILHALEYAEDPLVIAAEAERILAPEGEIMVTSSHPAMLHSWLGRKWVLFNLDDGRKHAKRLWTAKRAPPLDTLESADTPPESDDTPPEEPPPQADTAEGL